MPAPPPTEPADAPPLSAAELLAASPAEGDLEALLDVATAEFARYGVARTSLTDIARRAGVSRPTAYRRLGSKDLLLRRILVREMRRFFTSLAAALEGVDDPVDRAVEAFAVGVRTAWEHPLASHLLAEEPGALVPHLADRGAPWIAAARAALAAVLGPGDGTDALAHRRAEVVVRLSTSFFLTRESALLAPGPDGLRALADTVVRAAVEAA
ncbi:helix-turn-helix domain-containing protein [Patulibacter brassicae]|jgi:AcrR family transcriptional regulator|uniref:Helix-turn-helix domain-containing protein n=1 Tax=Patulibacter brassicae TaxID=1705717 RepID=A0ABU4VJ03_9ACTN|nr:helix-turn-helix domain-containing protein [Patulibacter brassicae]MDX8151810.1 helix-turn-helix domain-containing protein [Patulibacter brassicae]